VRSSTPTRLLASAFALATLILGCERDAIAAEPGSAAATSNDVAQSGDTAPRRRPRRLHWDPSWTRFETPNYVVTGLAAGITVASFLIPPAPDPWKGRDFAVDSDVRDALRLRSPTTATHARDTSDVLLGAMIAYPLLVDSVIVAWWHRRSDDVAEQTALITVETLAIASAVQNTVAGFSSRERPYGRRCGVDLDDRAQDCTTRNRYRAFFSGHTTASFAAAGVLCVHHAHIPFYGGAGDAIVCGAGLAGAGVVGLLRVSADQHYASDVLTGAAFGTLSGFGVPLLLHYGLGGGRRRAAFVERLHVAPIANGLSLGGAF
jgi:membrane-associated phospholipid phosphatase